MRAGSTMTNGYSNESTHRTLLARLREPADDAAWREFCDRYGELIRGFAGRRGLQASDCDDAVQDTMMALTKAMPGFSYDPAKGSFRGYLKTIVFHVILRKSYQKPGDRSLEDYMEQGEAAEAANAEDDWETEWRQYHLRLAMRTIEAEFNEKDRAAFDAYAVRGCDAGETAARLGVSVDQVYQAKSRILRRVGELVSSQVREEG